LTSEAPTNNTTPATVRPPAQGGGSPFGDMEPPAGSIGFNPLAMPMQNNTPGESATVRQFMPTAVQEAVVTEFEQPVSPQETAQSMEPPTSSSDIISFLSFADVQAAPIRPQSPPEIKTFNLGGKQVQIQFSTASRTDAQAFVEAISILQTPYKPIKVTTPEGKRLNIFSRVYLAELNFVSAIVMNPKWSVDEWAIFADRFGANGANPGEHGFQDVMEFAASCNNVNRMKGVEDEKRAGEKSKHLTEPADSSVPPSS
jgi:hypothetical protein